ncbi:hypothetical protein ID850_16925 [Xenorhabdus sp. Flor]|uniref:hypothetical protein n=1 Tax=Xenorhabdus cabanillasii TaxID=351673 RepID=UPI0019ACE122|nr:hypothetical protein [Xenorhabdus sp. Flor]MBD2816384.1 hypothetical protein [Xenorhabdus sp. Flor]
MRPFNPYSNRDDEDIELGELPNSLVGYGQLPSSFQASAARGFEHLRHVRNSPILRNFNSPNEYSEHSGTEMRLSRSSSISRESPRRTRSCPRLPNKYSGYSRTEMPLSRSHSFSGSLPRGYEFTTLTLSEVIPELITKYKAKYAFIKADSNKLKTIIDNAELDVKDRKIVKEIVELILNNINIILNDDKVDRYHKLYDINYQYPPFSCCSCNIYTVLFFIALAAIIVSELITFILGVNRTMYSTAIEILIVIILVSSAFNMFKESVKLIITKGWYRCTDNKHGKMMEAIDIIQKILKQNRKNFFGDVESTIDERKYARFLFTHIGSNGNERFLSKVDEICDQYFKDTGLNPNKSIYDKLKNISQCCRNKK